MDRILIYLLFTLSGCVGLIYEALWSRYLKLLLGHASYGQVLTLVIFMGGLGIGAFLGGRLAARHRSPLRLYGIIEILVGLGGIVYHNIYQTGSQFFYHISPNLPTGLILPTKLLIAFATTGPLAILLGMTFPALAIGLMRRHGDKGEVSLPWLYFTNSLGGAIGIVSASYWLIPHYGTLGALNLAAAGNLLIGIVFYLLGKPTEMSATTDSPHLSQPHPVSQRRGLIPLLMATSLLTGLSSFVYEVGWLRLLSMIMGSSTHSFDIMVSAFIFGLAGGGLFARVLLKRSSNPILTLAIVQLAMGVLAALSLGLYETCFDLVNSANLVLQRSAAAYPVYSVFKYLLCLLLMFPASFCAGMTLPLITWLVIHHTQQEKWIGAVYGWNTIGSILGSVLGGLILMPLLQLKWTILSGALIDIALGVVLLASIPISLPILGAAPLAILLLLTPIWRLQLNNSLLSSGAYRSQFNAEMSNQSEITMRHGKTASIAFQKHPQFLALLTNGKPDASVNLYQRAEASGDDITQTALAVYPMQMMEKPYQAAMIGMGSGMTAHVLLTDPLLQQLDLIEIEEEVYHQAKGFLPFNRLVYESPKVQHIVDDAKTYFHTQKKAYDLIISEPSNPWVSGVSSLFTQEFYHDIKRFLTPEGSLVQWIHTYEFNDDLLFSILQALQKEFPHVRIYGQPKLGQLSPQTNDIFIIARQSEFDIPATQRVNDNNDLSTELARLNLKAHDFSDFNFITDLKALTPLLKNYNPNSDFFPLVDNQSEKAFYLKESVNVIDLFLGSILPYQGINNPRFEAQRTQQLRYKSQTASISDQVLLTKLKAPKGVFAAQTIVAEFYRYITPQFPIMNWQHNEVTKAFKQWLQYYPELSHEQHIVQWLGFVQQKDWDAAQQHFPRLLTEIEKAPDLTPEFLRALAVYTLEYAPSSYPRVLTLVHQQQVLPPIERTYLNALGEPEQSQ